MGMIGNQLAAGTALTVANDSFNGNGSTTAFTLSQTVSATTDIEVLVDNVQQSPYDSSYSVSGTTLTFSAAPAAGTNNIYVIYNASKHISTNQVVPDDGSVVEAKLGAAAVTTAKLHDDAITHGKLPAGTVIQYAHVTGSQKIIVSSTTSWTSVGVSITFTPKFANSLIQVYWDGHLSKGTSSAGGFGWALYQDNTALHDVGQDAGSRPWSSYKDETRITDRQVRCITHSAGSTNARTYTCKFKAYYSADQIRSCNDSSDGGEDEFMSVMEIAQ